LIKKLKGELGAHSSEVEQLKKDIKENEEAQQEASEVRAKENEDYVADKSEAEQCIGALEAAIKVLRGAGTGSKGFLQSFKEAQLISVAADVQRVFRRDWSEIASEEDIDKVKSFFANPRQAISALQVGTSPYGDYAPQSTQIQGILKGMYDAFAASLEKANAEEAAKEKAFEDLMETKANELQTLQATLEAQETDEAHKDMKLSESISTRDDSKKQVSADEEFFEDTKKSCNRKANQWAVRSRMRAEELVSIQTAIGILGDSKAMEVFNSSSSSFLQISSSNKGRRVKTYKKLKRLSAKYGGLALAQVAAQFKSSGHFTKVIAQVDSMIALLMREETADVAARDRCESQAADNAGKMEDLAHDKERLEEEIARHSNLKKELTDRVETLTKAIDATKIEMEDRLELRNEEHKDFVQALQADAGAADLLKRAITVVTDFFRKNKIPLSLEQSQTTELEPEYSADPFKEPETSWSADNTYKSRKSQAGNVISVMSAILEKTRNKIKVDRQDDAEAAESFLRDKQASEKVLQTQQTSMAEAAQELSSLEIQTADKEESLDETKDELEAKKDAAKTLETDCAWVSTNFSKRREKRKTEIEGLREAKNALAGAATGDYAELEVAEPRDRESEASAEPGDKESEASS